MMKNLFKIFILLIGLQTFTINAFAFDGFVCHNGETTIYRNESTPDVLEFVSEDGDGRRLRIDIRLTTRKVNENRETQTYLFETNGETHALSVSARRDLWRDENGKGTLLLIDIEKRKISEEAQFSCQVTVD